MTRSPLSSAARFLPILGLAARAPTSCSSNGDGGTSAAPAPRHVDPAPLATSHSTSAADLSAFVVRTGPDLVEIAHAESSLPLASIASEEKAPEERGESHEVMRIPRFASPSRDMVDRVLQSDVP